MNTLKTASHENRSKPARYGEIQSRDALLYVHLMHLQPSQAPQQENIHRGTARRQHFCRRKNCSRTSIVFPQRREISTQSCFIGMRLENPCEIGISDLRTLRSSCLQVSNETRIKPSAKSVRGFA